MIELKHINKQFHDKKILEDFHLKIETGDFIAIVGESGSGKTTLLNIVGLLEKADSGDVVIDGQINPNGKQTLLLQRNKFGYLFQNYALIENETVEKNLQIAFRVIAGARSKPVIDQKSYAEGETVCVWRPQGRGVRLSRFAAA